MMKYKGFHKGPDGGIELISNYISKHLKIPCYVLMGANIAHEVAKENVTEATIGCEDLALGSLFKSIMQVSYFRVQVSDDRETVEICGALKVYLCKLTFPTVTLFIF